MAALQFACRSGKGSVLALLFGYASLCVHVLVTGALRDATRFIAREMSVLADRDFSSALIFLCCCSSRRTRFTVVAVGVFVVMLNTAMNMSQQFGGYSSSS